MPNWGHFAGCLTPHGFLKQSLGQSYRGTIEPSQQIALLRVVDLRHDFLGVLGGLFIGLGASFSGSGPSAPTRIWSSSELIASVADRSGHSASVWKSLSGQEALEAHMLALLPT